jgi:signal transduction histidine kinase
MTRAPTQWQQTLLAQLSWFIRLRWLAGCAVIAGSALEWRWLRVYEHPGAIALMGAAILVYNLILWLGMRWVRVKQNRNLLLGTAWLQLLLDLACLTWLTLLTGGLTSPLLGFFVFHMVFSSLLLPRLMAYAGASMAMAMLSAGLWSAGHWPEGPRESASLLGWSLTLLIIVWLTNRLTLALRRQRRRLIRQNRRIRGMSETLRRQQEGMVQHEKMVAMGQMAAGVAHEIANPLASMDGLLQLAERRPERLRPEMVSTLREQIARINQIVRQMTTFAHPGAGRRQLTSLNEVAARVLEVVRFDPRYKGVTVQRDFAADLPQISMMTEAIQQVLLNLLINALDAMEGVEEPILTVRTEYDSSFCSVTIADNGTGIPIENQKRIFEPFFTTKPVGKGTGLGLSISYSLVRKHGGEIHVESTPGQGASFTVRLPLGPADETSAAEALSEKYVR